MNYDSKSLLNKKIIFDSKSQRPQTLTRKSEAPFFGSTKLHTLQKQKHNKEFEYETYEWGRGKSVALPLSATLVAESNLTSLRNPLESWVAPMYKVMLEGILIHNIVMGYPIHPLLQVGSVSFLQKGLYLDDMSAQH
ncbi:hypothetical protein Ahy_B01g052018 isoform B [Arachis hypogaea]|uniref:Uncharacterized protein n=1 Tax=Arachis hypogaea TaxID=3818 RepID=A0A445ANH4_ARAHY|nr:hypothetical protein Ahy_B01g052018 isoform B [Arachis hypogaea]